MSREVIEAAKRIAPTLPPAARWMVSVILKDKSPSPNDILFLKTLLGTAPIPAPHGVTPTKIPLRGFQEEGVRMIDFYGGSALLADEAGVGKTPQALGYLTLRKGQATPAIVVCTSATKVNWYRETLRFTDLRPLVITGKSTISSLLRASVECSADPEPGYDVYIVNYELFRAVTDPHTKRLRSATINGRSLSQFKFIRQVVFDEIHHIKDPKTQVTKASLELCKGLPTLGMSGTPLMNRSKDLFTQVYAVNPTLFPKFFDFGLRYCDGKRVQVSRTKKVWDFSGNSNLDELDRILRGKVMIRRKKTDVLSELPPFTRVTIPIALSASHESGYLKKVEESKKTLVKFRALRDEFRAAVSALSDSEKKKALSLHAKKSADLSKLRLESIGEVHAAQKAAALGKLGEAVKFISDLRASAGRLLVFTIHHDVTDAVRAAVEKEGLSTCVIDGRSPDKQPLIDGFQAGKFDVAVCGIRAIKEGVTLTAASSEVFVEFGWNPSDHEQAEARINRMGQKSATTAYYLVALGTIEESLVRMIDAKREVVNTALGEGDRTVSENGILDAIVNEILGGGK